MIDRRHLSLYALSVCFLASCGGGGGSSSPTESSDKPNVIAELRDLDSGAFYRSANNSTRLNVAPFTRPSPFAEVLLVPDRLTPVVDGAGNAEIRPVLAYQINEFANRIVVVLENFSLETRCDIRVSAMLTSIDSNTGAPTSVDKQMGVLGYHGYRDDGSTVLQATDNCVAAGEFIYIVSNTLFPIGVDDEEITGVEIKTIESAPGRISTAAMEVNDFTINPIGDNEDTLSVTLTNLGAEPTEPFNDTFNSLNILVLDVDGLPLWIGGQSALSRTVANANVENIVLLPGETQQFTLTGFFSGLADLTFHGEAHAVRFFIGLPDDEGLPDL